jgi:phosphoglucomutase
MEEMAEIMNRLRISPPRRIGGMAVVSMADYLTGMTRDMESGKCLNDIELPRSNVLQFKLEGESMFTVRPSGTEPKIKLYGSCCSPAGMALRQARPETSARAARLREGAEALLL